MVFLLLLTSALLFRYRKQIDLPNSSGTTSGLIGHVHLDKVC